jgi:hypothetical protein
MHWKIPAAICVMMIALFAQAARRSGRLTVSAGNSVNLPFNIPDNSGNQWMIYPSGWLQQQGNTPVYSQGAMLLINGAQMNNATNQARVDEKTDELVFENLNAANLNVTRRIRIDQQDNYVRYIDILKNSTQQDISVNFQINTSFNAGIQSSQTLEDPRNKQHVLAWVGQTEMGRAVVEIYGCKGAKLVPQINAQPNNNIVQAMMQLTVPAGKQIALLHIHATAASSDAGMQFVSQTKDSEFLGDIPSELRKLIVNIGPAQTIGEREILRGDLFDIVELSGGDQMKGTINETSFKLNTSYGPIELPAERVVSLFNVGQFRPRQLIVTVDGEVFGGTLAKNTIAMQLSSGQTTQVPLAQITRMGYRKRAGEPEEWTFDHPMIILHSGERMNIAAPDAPVDVMTRYGSLKIPPKAIAQIAFESTESGVHQIRLIDDSKFAGLVAADHFDFQLTGTATPQKVSFPTSAIAQLQFTNKIEDPGKDDPTLQLTNQDQLVGVLSGVVKLDTAFDTITINCPEIRGLTHTADNGMDVQITLWDQTTLSGQLHEPQLACDLQSGVSVTIPIGLVDKYSNPQPRPSAMMVDRIKAVVADLSTEDWKQRERAEAQLVAMGPIVVGVLKEISGSVPPEAQQRIDSVLKQLEKSPSSVPTMNFMNKD